MISLFKLGRDARPLSEPDTLTDDRYGDPGQISKPPEAGPDVLMDRVNWKFNKKYKSSFAWT